MTSCWYCPNPSCPRGDRGFLTYKAFSSHSRLSDLCREYLHNDWHLPFHSENSRLAVDAIPYTNANNVTTPIINAHAPTNINLLQSLDSINCPAVYPAVARIPTPTSSFEGSISSIGSVDNVVLKTDMDESVIFCKNDSIQSSNVRESLVVPNIAPAVNVFVAADFEQFSDTSNESEQDDNSAASSIHSVRRFGYLDAIPFSNHQPPLQSFPIPMHENVNTIFSHYNNLERRLAASDLQRNIICNSVEHKAIADLMMILELAGSPDYLITHIMGWARDASESGYNFHPQALGRKDNLSWMYSMLPNSSAYCPTMLEVHGLETYGGKTHTRKMACFDFATIMTSFLMNTELMVAEYSNLDPVNPFAMCESIDGKLGEPISGSVYRDMYAALPQDSNTLLAPPIFFIDGTQFTSKGNRELIPVTMTLAIFNIAARRQRRFWRLLGYIPDPKLGMSSNDLNKANSGYACRNFHRCMTVMLRGYRACQTKIDPRLQGLHLKLFQRWNTCDVKAPLLSTIVDGKQGDISTGRFSGHTKGLQRHHRYCDTSFDNLINTSHKCNPILARESRRVAEHGTLIECQSQSTYRHDNAFADIDMGEHDQGIHLVAGPDTMHSIENGMILLCLELTNTASLPSSLNALDDFGKGFATQIKQQITKSFPRMSFVHGITTVTFLSCSEKVGMMFLYTAAFMFADVHKKMDVGFAAKKDVAYHVMKTSAIRNAMEEILIYHAWLQRESYWDTEDRVEPRRCHTKIKALIDMLKIAFPEPTNAKGHHLSTSKIHEQLHTVDHMEKMGGLIHINASTGEANHSYFAKDKAARSHNNHATMEIQTAHRITDAMVIESVHHIFNQSELTSISTEASRPGGTRFCINQVCDDVNTEIQVVFHTKTKGGMEVVPGIAQYLVQQFQEERFPNDTGSLWCRTEHSWILEGGELQTVRCHSNYNSGGCAHYDWAYIKFEPVGQIELFPCRVVAVVDQLKNKLDTTYLVVQCCYRTLAAEARQPRSKKNISKLELAAAKSKLFTVWMFSHKFELVPIESYNRPCLAFWNTCIDRDRENVVRLPGVNRIVIAEDKSLWSSKF